MGVPRTVLVANAPQTVRESEGLPSSCDLLDLWPIIIHKTTTHATSNTYNRRVVLVEGFDMGSGVTSEAIAAAWELRLSLLG